MRSNQTLFDQITPEGMWQTLLQLRSTRRQSYLEQFVHDDKGLNLLSGVREIAFQRCNCLSDNDAADVKKKFLDTRAVVDAAWNCAMGNKIRRDYPDQQQSMKEDTVRDCMSRRAGIR